jgi:hypothetical protein
MQTYRSPSLKLANLVPNDNAVLVPDVAYTNLYATARIATKSRYTEFSTSNQSSAFFFLMMIQAPEKTSCHMSANEVCVVPGAEKAL